MDPSVDGLTHVVDFTYPANTAGLVNISQLLAEGQFYAQAFDADGLSVMSGLTDQSNVSVSVAVQDVNGNIDEVAPSDVALLDTTADVGDDLAVAVDSVVNDTEAGTVQITLSGVDANDVASPGGIVVTVGDSNADEIEVAKDARDKAGEELATLNAQLTPLEYRCARKSRVG